MARPVGFLPSPGGPPIAFYSSPGLIRRRSGLDVTMAPLANSASKRASTGEHARPCSDARKPTSRTTPAWGLRSATASSPRSLSSVMSTRPSECARLKTSSSPGSTGQSPAQISIPRTCSTARRRPLREGFPPKTSGLTVIRSSRRASVKCNPLSDHSQGGPSAFVPP